MTQILFKFVITAVIAWHCMACFSPSSSPEDALDFSREDGTYVFDFLADDPHHKQYKEISPSFQLSQDEEVNNSWDAPISGSDLVMQQTFNIDAKRTRLVQKEGQMLEFQNEQIVIWCQQKEVGACEMLAECRADYEELYEMLAGANVDKVSRDEVSDLSWWWDFQIGRYVSMRGWVIDMENVKFKDGFFYYAYGDDWLVNTCVQHSESWADPCDNSAGYCAGGGNYGFSSQQATALTEALEQPSFIHPKCPSGCQALDDDWLAEIAQAAPSLPDASLSALCILDSKYFFWVDPLTIVETCVGYNDQSTALCPLSDYIFCSDIDYDTGSVVYGNSTYQGYSLEYALSSDNYRHPQCL